MINEEVYKAFIDTMKVPDWVQLLVKLTVKMIDRSWKTMLNFLNLGRSGVNVIINFSVITKVFRKTTFTGLFTNFFSFTSYSYKTGLIATLVHRAYMINNTWSGFHEELAKLKGILLKNSYPTTLIDNIIKNTINKFFDNPSDNTKVNDNIFYVKLPYVGKFSSTIKKRVNQLLKRLCNNNIKINIVFSSYKIRSMFGVKDSIPKELRSFVVYKFTCSSCGACYVGETSRHFATRINEHLKTDKVSHIYKHIMSSKVCLAQCSPESFCILDRARNSYELKIKEAIHILWEKPTLNQQLSHFNLKLSL